MFEAAVLAPAGNGVTGAFAATGVASDALAAVVAVCGPGALGVCP